MFNKEIVENLSEFLGIKFNYSSYLIKMSCIFSDDNKKPAFSFLIKNGTLTPTEKHLSSLPYKFREYENLNYNHLNMFAKLLSKDIFGTETELLDWCVKRKYFETLIV